MNKSLLKKIDVSDSLLTKDSFLYSVALEKIAYTEKIATLDIKFSPSFLYGFFIFPFVIDFNNHKTIKSIVNKGFFPCELRDFILSLPHYKDSDSFFDSGNSGVFTLLVEEMLMKIDSEYLQGATAGLLLLIEKNIRLHHFDNEPYIHHDLKIYYAIIGIIQQPDEWLSQIICQYSLEFFNWDESLNLCDYYVMRGKIIITPDLAKKIDYNFKSIPIKLLSPSLCLEAVSKTPHVFCDIPDEYMTEQIIEIALKNDPFLLEFAPFDKLTEKLCLLAVTQNGFSLRHIPKSLKTEKTCRSAILNRLDAIQFVPKEIIILFKSDEQFIDYLKAKLVEESDIELFEKTFCS